MPEIKHEDVLTLAEAASYLRVSEDELLRLSERQDIPGQKIGGEWRFLKRALDYWLTCGPTFLRDSLCWFPTHAVIEDLLFAIEKRLHKRLESGKPARGTKQAVQKHLGVFQNEGDLNEVLAGLAKMRRSDPAEDEE